MSLIGANRVVKFDRQDKIVGQFEMETPGMLALADTRPARRQPVDERRQSAEAHRDHRPTTMKGEELDVLFPRPHPVAATPTGFAYTGSLGVNQIASIELAEPTASRITNVAGPTHSLVQFATTRDGKTLVGNC